MKYSLILFIFFFIQCKEQKKEVKNDSKRVLEETRSVINDTIILTTGTYILSPNGEELKQLKEKHEHDNFYVMADDANYYKAEVSGLLNGKGINLSFSVINFKNEGYIFDKKKYEYKWLVIDYQKGSKPKIFALVDYYSHLLDNDMTLSSVQLEEDNLNNHEIRNNIFEGSWKSRGCDDSIGIRIKKDGSLVMCIAPNQGYFYFTKIDNNNLRYKLTRREGLAAEEYFIESYLNDEATIEIKILDKNKIEFNWLGFYNKDTKKRDYTESLFADNNPVILRKCE